MELFYNQKCFVKEAFVKVGLFGYVNCIMKNEICQYIREYRLNKFVIKANVQDGWMLYNTTTGGVVFIQSEADLYESLNKLVELYYYVPLSFDEVKWVNKLRKGTDYASKVSCINGFTILTTTDCNARCFYCYEKGLPRVTMTDKVAKDVADYIIKVSSGAPVHLRWFGGEPLLNHNAIDIISNNLNENGIKFQSTMISNGLLFTDSIIKKAKSLWKLKKIQITLDGTKVVYQTAKSFEGADGNEFQRVTDNISKLSDANIRVSIRLNQDFYNTTDLLELIDFLSLKYRKNKHISVYNNWLYGDNNETTTLIEESKYEKFKQLQDKLIRCGLFHRYPLEKKIRLTHCMADNDASVLITPEGGIGKCEHFTYQHLIGSIYNTKTDYREILRWKEQYQPTKKCLECPLYPQCIRIKMCPVEREKCSWDQCENKIELIKRALVKKYESFRNKIETTENKV